MNRHDLQQLARYMRWQDTNENKRALKTGLSLSLLKPLREWVYSFAAFCRKRQVITPVPCDVLLLHYSQTSQARGYRDALVTSLRKRGLRVVETAIHKPKTVLSRRELLSPGWTFPHRYYFHAAYARWLIGYYQPKALLTDKNGSILAPFLKTFIQPYGKLVHIAHSIPTENFRKFSMNAYDYYFLFGRSSLERLQKRQRFGTSQVFLTGTYAEKMPLQLPEKNTTVLILGTGPALEKTRRIQSAYAVIRATAHRLPAFHFIVKPHPRSDKTVWLSDNPPDNLTVANPDENIDTLLKNAFVAIGSFTNAAIDCALQQRPFILVSEGDTDPQLDIHRMAPLCNTAEQLANTITTIAANPDTYRDHARNFADYHLSNGFTGPDTISALIYTLVMQGALAGGVTLTDTLFDGNSREGNLREGKAP